MVSLNIFICEWANIDLCNNGLTSEVYGRNLAVWLFNWILLHSTNQIESCANFKSWVCVPIKKPVAITSGFRLHRHVACSQLMCLLCLTFFVINTMISSLEKVNLKVWLTFLLNLIRCLWMCIVCWKWQTFYHPPACPSSNGDSTLTFDGRIALERNFINFSPFLFPVTLLPMKCIFAWSGSILDMYVPRFFQKLWNQEQTFQVSSRS